MQIKIAQDDKAPKPGKLALQSDIRDIYEKLGTFIEDSIPNSRERSLALTNLEQSMMWVGKAIFND